VRRRCPSIKFQAIFGRSTTSILRGVVSSFIRERSGTSSNREPGEGDLEISSHRARKAVPWKGESEGGEAKKVG
jgi:hypothetical protein